MNTTKSVTITHLPPALINAACDTARKAAAPIEPCLNWFDNGRGGYKFNATLSHPMPNHLQGVCARVVTAWADAGLLNGGNTAWWID